MTRTLLQKPRKCGDKTSPVFRFFVHSLILINPIPPQKPTNPEDDLLINIQYPINNTLSTRFGTRPPSGVGRRVERLPQDASLRS
jgi:hypothetical protein